MDKEIKPVTLKDMQELSASFTTLTTKLKDDFTKLTKEIHALASKAQTFTTQGSAPVTETKGAADSQEVHQKTVDMLNNVASSLYNSMYAMSDNIHRRINNLVDTHYKHADTSTHLPAVKGAAQMKKAVAALGLDDEYDVKKNVLYCSTKQGLVIEADFKKAK